MGESHKNAYKANTYKLLSVALLQSWSLIVNSYFHLSDK